MTKRKKKRPLTAWQKHVKAYMAKHPGLSFKEALPKAKQTYRNPYKPRKAKPSSRRKHRMPKKKSRRRSFFNMSTMFKLARIAAFVAPVAADALEPGKSPQEKAWNLTRHLTGYDTRTKKWQMSDLMAGPWIPFLAVTAVTYGVQKIGGIIRRL